MFHDGVFGNGQATAAQSLRHRLCRRVVPSLVTLDFGNDEHGFLTKN